MLVGSELVGWASRVGLFVGWASKVGLFVGCAEAVAVPVGTVVDVWLGTVVSVAVASVISLWVGRGVALLVGNKLGATMIAPPIVMLPAPAWAMTGSMVGVGVAVDELVLVAVGSGL